MEQTLPLNSGLGFYLISKSLYSKTAHLLPSSGLDVLQKAFHGIRTSQVKLFFCKVLKQSEMVFMVL